MNSPPWSHGKKNVWHFGLTHSQSHAEGQTHSFIHPHTHAHTLERTLFLFPSHRTTLCLSLLSHIDTYMHIHVTLSKRLPRYNPTVTRVVLFRNDAAKDEGKSSRSKRKRWVSCVSLSCVCVLVCDCVCVVLIRNDATKDEGGKSSKRSKRSKSKRWVSCVFPCVSVCVCTCV